MFFWRGDLVQTTILMRGTVCQPISTNETVLRNINSIDVAVRCQHCGRVVGFTGFLLEMILEGIFVDYIDGPSRGSHYPNVWGGASDTLGRHKYVKTCEMIFKEKVFIFFGGRVETPLS